jgi:transcriptional regulator with XRE-family HTH domain
MDFGLRLAVIQLEEKLMNKDLAKILEVDPVQVARYRQMRDVKLSVAVRIAKAVNRPLEDFLEE